MLTALLIGALLIIFGGSLYALSALSRQIELPDFQGSIPLGEFSLVEAELNPSPRVPPW